MKEDAYDWVDDAGLDLEQTLRRFRRLTPADVAARADEWRVAPIGSPAAQVDLHEYLGMTWDQYRRWAATGEIPTF